MIDLPVINMSPYELPSYSTSSSAGLDLRANIKKPLFLNSFQRILIPTGLKICLPETFEGQIRPRSGLALKHGVTVLNSPGTIDADYKGEVGVILINLSDKMYEIKPGDRIAQMIISNFSNVNWKLVEDIGRSKRGSSGFGSSGSN
tara:strand:- start:770 stop:1207 length:438 start_codon:yes stop_codon:yes gene_type:complete